MSTVPLSVSLLIQKLDLTLLNLFSSTSPPLSANFLLFLFFLILFFSSHFLKLVFFHLTGFNITSEMIFLNWRDEKTKENKNKFIAFNFISDIE
jgi:hypothetical protein